MSNINYLSDWENELCLQMITENKNLCDFNRLLYKNFPTTMHIQHGKPIVNANRSGFILQIKDCFAKNMEEGVSHDTLYNIFSVASQYLRWCDQEAVDAFTQISIEGYMSTLYERVLLGNLKRSTYTAKLSRMVTLFRDHLDLPSDYFQNITPTGKDDVESFEAYTKSDLKQLLPFLRQLFNQTSKQFLADPQKHIKAHRSTASMIFHWKGCDYHLYAAITKMMCAATYLLAYYTYTNTSDLFSLKRPKAASSSLSEVWYTMPAFKRRAFKLIQVEVGEHGILDIPKYSMSFFDKLLEVSALLDDSDDALLLQTVASRALGPIKSVTLQDFFRGWAERHFTFTDQTGQKLRPTISRFRETGSQITAYHQGEIVNDIMLNNTLITRKRSYSKGNRHTNNGMMQDALSIKQQQARSKQDIKSAKKSLGIDVLVIEKENIVNIPKLSRTPNGGSCANPFGEKSLRYTKKAQSHNLLKEGEKLACAALLECFGCPEQVIVQSVSDIWCLLSFKGCIEESLYLHLNAHHYRKNFEDIVKFINEKILPNLDKQLLKQAETNLDEQGYHPLWDDNASILAMIPATNPHGAQP